MPHLKKEPYLCKKKNPHRLLRDSIPQPFENMAIKLAKEKFSPGSGYKRQTN
jgi:hypothetical protein